MVKRNVILVLTLVGIAAALAALGCGIAALVHFHKTCPVCATAASASSVLGTADSDKTTPAQRGICPRQPASSFIPTPYPPLTGENCLACYESGKLGECSDNLNANKATLTQREMCNVIGGATAAGLPVPMFPPPQIVPNPPVDETFGVNNVGFPPTVPPFLRIPMAGKNVLVIGGSRGIGRATAMAFAQAGANVIATSRHPDCYPATWSTLPPSWTGTLRLMRLDVRFDSDVAAFMTRLLTDAVFAGKIDVMVIGASVHWAGRYLDATGDDLERYAQSNLFGYQRALHYGVPLMRHANTTRVIGIGSFSGYAAQIYTGPYATFKLALRRMFEMVQAEELIAGNKWPRYSLIEPFNVLTELGVYENAVPTDQDPRTAPLTAAQHILFDAQDYLPAYPNPRNLTQQSTPPVIAQQIYDIATAPEPSVRYIGGLPSNGFVPFPGDNGLTVYEIEALTLFYSNTFAFNVLLNASTALIASFSTAQPYINGILCSAL